MSAINNDPFNFRTNKDLSNVKLTLEEKIWIGYQVVKVKVKAN